MGEVHKIPTVREEFEKPATMGEAHKEPAVGYAYKTPSMEEEFKNTATVWEDYEYKLWGRNTGNLTQRGRISRHLLQGGRYIQNLL